MEDKKKAIYVHGLGSGAASTTVEIVRKVFSNYEWTAVEVNEDPVDSVSTINQAIAELRPAFLMGTSLGGLYLMYADMDSCEEGAIRFLFNRPVTLLASSGRQSDSAGRNTSFLGRMAYRNMNLTRLFVLDLRTSLPVTIQRLVRAMTLRCSQFTTNSSG